MNISIYFIKYFNIFQYISTMYVSGGQATDDFFVQSTTTSSMPYMLRSIQSSGQQIL